MPVDPTTFQVDAPLPTGAAWLRVITNHNHITKENTLHLSALKRQISPPDDPTKPWSHELSGAARCFFATAQDALDYCEAFVQGIRDRAAASGKPVFAQFAGVICGKAADLSFQLQNTHADTAFTPNTHDGTHTDVVAFGTTDQASVDAIEIEFRKHTLVLRPTELQKLMHL